MIMPELTTREKIEVMTAVDNGMKCAYYSVFVGLWVYAPEPLWNWADGVYRLTAPEGYRHKDEFRVAKFWEICLIGNGVAAHCRNETSTVRRWMLEKEMK